MSIAIVALSIIIALVAIGCWLASTPLPRWPAPTIKPYECIACRCRFATAGHLVAHSRFHLEADFEHHSFEVRP